MPVPPPSNPSWKFASFLLATGLLLYVFFFPLGELASSGSPLAFLAQAVHFLLGIGALKAEDHPHFIFMASGLRLLLIALCALAPLLCALVLGRRILAYGGSETEERPDRWVFACATGFGGLAILTLLLGLTVGLHRPLFVILVAALGLLGLRDISDCRADIQESLRNLSWKQGGWLALATGLPAFLVVACACLAAFVPPLDYDVLEYHLGAPAYYFREGRISFIAYNVYSNFPFNTEMLYLLCTVLADDTLIGAFVAQLVNVELGLLCAAAVGLAARRLFNERAGWIAAVIFLTCPWFTLGAIKAYDTLALSLFTFLAVYSLFRYARQMANPAESGSWLRLCAIFTGLAMGTKYPSFLFVWIPVVVVTGVCGLWHKIERSRLLRQLGLALFLPLLIVSPWLIKNLAYTGNPVYPLLGSVLESPEWDAERNARFVRAHQSPPLPAMELVREAGRKAFLSEGATPLFLVFLLPLAWLPERRAAVFFLGYSLLFFLLWAYFTHRIDRFLVPALPGLCLLAGAGFSACAGRGTQAVAAAALAVLVLYHTLEALIFHSHLDGLAVAVGTETADEYLRRRTEASNYSAEAVEYLNRELVPKLKAGEKVLFLGDAETLYCSQNYFLSATVFDRQWLDKALEVSGHSGVARSLSSDELARGVTRMREAGVAYLYVNWPEIFRLQTSYAFDYGGASRPGYLNSLHDPAKFPPGIQESQRFSYFVRLEYRSGLFSPDALGGFLEEVKRFGSSPSPEPPFFAIYRMR